MLTRREFLAVGAGTALFPRDALARDERVEYELAELRRTRVLDSMQWAAEWCRRHPPAAGVGPVAGSLVAYRLGLTRIDPVKNGLFFERFLNPERTDPPRILLAADYRDVGRQTNWSVDSPVLLGENVEAWGLDLQGGMNETIQEKALRRVLQATTTEDRAIALALARPGPIQEGLTGRYVRRRLGEKWRGHPHSALRPILRDTWGVWVWQEQVMRAAVEVAGFSSGDADTLRRALGCKDARALFSWRDAFTGCAEQRFVVGSEQMYDDIAFYAGYTASKAHYLAWADLALRGPARD